MRKRYLEGSASPPSLEEFEEEELEELDDEDGPLLRVEGMPMTTTGGLLLGPRPSLSDKGSSFDESCCCCLCSCSSVIGLPWRRAAARSGLWMRERAVDSEASMSSTRILLRTTG